MIRPQGGFNIDGEEKAFTTKEFDLLTFLAENPNHVFTKEELFREIWDMDSIRGSRYRYGLLRKIREKIEGGYGKSPSILKRLGSWYRFKV